MANVSNIVAGCFPLPAANVRPNSLEILKFLDTKYPLTADACKQKNAVEKYFENLMGAVPTKQITPLDRWVSSLLSIASGSLDFDPSFKKQYLVINANKEPTKFNLSRLIDNLGYHNSFALMVACYQLASQRASLADAKTAPKLRQMANIFGESVKDLVTIYPTNYNQIDFLKLTFKREDISPQFATQLDKTAKYYNKVLSALGSTYVIGLFGLGVAASGTYYLTDGGTKIPISSIYWVELLRNL